MTTKAPTRSPTTAEFVSEAIDFFLEDTHTALPGRVKSYDPVEQRAEIQPLVQRLIIAEDGEEILEALPVIPDVPVGFPRSGEFFISFPIKQDDLGMLFFAERSLDNYLSSDGTRSEGYDPEEFRKHDMTDAVFYPGVYPWSKAIGDAHADNLVIGKDGGGLQIHIKDALIALGEENPIEKVLLGTVFRSNQAAMHTSLGTNLGTEAASLGTAGASLTSMGTDPAFAAAFPAAAGFAAAAGAALTAASAAVQDFQSNSVSVKT
jgi:hypothetical protein